MTRLPLDPRQGTLSGFALVITLALMTLLVVISIGLLSLSAVSLRGGAADRARAEARANARLALALALAQLQKQTGVDTRITAPADFLAPAAPLELAHSGWRGVWRSNPTTPKAYQAARADFFSEWLVTTTGQPLGLEAARAAIPGESRVIRKVDGMPDLRVPVIPTPNQGRLGWWTDDESLKALANLPDRVPPSKGAAAAAAHAAPRMAPESVPGVAGFDSSAGTAAALLSPGQITLAAGTWPDPQGLHFTTYSKSVLADVRNGGLKQDLSTLFEQAPDRITEFGKWTGSGSESDKKAYLYGPAGVAMGARWNHMYAYYRLYKDVAFSGSEPRVEPQEQLIDWHLADQFVDFGDEAGGFRYPRMTKIIYVFSYTAVKDPAASNPKPYSLHLGTDVFVTLWNPFDARIHFPLNSKFFAKFSFVLPMTFEFQVASQPKVTVSPGEINGTGWFQRYFNNPSGDRQFSMSPGETVVFSLKEDPGSGSREFWPGAYFDGMTSKVTQVPSGNGTEKISAALKPAQPADAGGGDSVPNSQYIDFWIRDSVKGWPYYEHRGEILSRADAPFLKHMRPVNATDVPSVKLADVVGRKQPFGAFIMEIKTARDSAVPIPAFLNTGNTRLSSKLTSSAGEFANERLEYKVEAVTGFDSDIIQVTLPNHPAGPNHGYIGSGRSPATGQTHFLFASIPTVPPTSLAQFRHAGMGDGASTLRATYWGFNSTPNAPFADQSIGNSYAHPLLPPNTATKGTLLDHRYLGNEALWDKFFLSSLAPRSQARFGKESTMRESWTAFLEGQSTLINPRFSPWLGGEAPATAAGRFFASNRDSALRPDAYKRVSANLLFDGGFNVNSTSVEAWQAFLASSRLRSITRLPKAGGTKGQEIFGSGTVFSRTETVLDEAVESGAGGVASHYSGFRDLSDEQLGRLAKAIVEQVRKRGPFLNLSEFLNRRLATDPDLALSGALQSAIDSSGLNDPVAAAGLAGSNSPGGVTMAFPTASGFNTAAGNPGWLMQADLLDPLGPAIVARGDTFRIRGYGESLGRGEKVAARAWCEMVVQRVPGYLDTTEAPEVTAPKRPLNRRFGRRYEPVSFRWLVGPHE
jgi:hypothetical protein